jgi:hypothetical protein
MKTLQLTSSLFPIVRVGTYDGQTCDVNRFIDSYCIDDDFSEGHVDFDSEGFWDRYDNSKFVTEIRKRASDYITDEIKPFLVDLGFGITDVVVHDIVSPKYYNFSTDELYFDLIVDEDFTENLAHKVENEFYDSSLAKFLKDNYTSYDGFMSFTANTLDGLIEGIREGDVREISAFLTWYFINNFEGYEWSDYVYEDFPFYTEFLSDEVDA